MITPANITHHEFIGLETSIMESNNVQLIGLQGKIVDETKSMFIVETQTGIKKIPKENSTWKFNLDGVNVNLSGKTIAKRSYERIGVKI